MGAHAAAFFTRGHSLEFSDDGDPRSPQAIAGLRLLQTELQNRNNGRPLGLTLSPRGVPESGHSSLCMCIASERPACAADAIQAPVCLRCPAWCLAWLTTTLSWLVGTLLTLLSDADGDGDVAISSSTTHGSPAHAAHAVGTRLLPSFSRPQSLRKRVLSRRGCAGTGIGSHGVAEHLAERSELVFRGGRGG